ncbi:DEAD/DEAH box helicase [Thioalkalivibrio sp. ALE23]|uniref:DEAD/DEAH box helicase n=1 Tax=Thioalkalivibrio sp. ALE23 TaxID=1265495 RepID=UPI0003A4F191|nr:DEAD/DEAH box helicase [Thioalkalivibrio sp. ALE23]
MTFRELVQALSNEEYLRSNAFEILHQISAYVNSPSDEVAARELVLRALDKREALYGFWEVLDAFTREVGLYPYLEEEELCLRDLLAYEAHRPTSDSDIVFTRVQGEVFRRLDAGENVILSAPTSFGKSRIIDAVVSTGRHTNIVLIVPTIALIDETRRRLTDGGHNKKIITQVAQRPADSNIFVFTAERLLAYKELPKIDFFVVDEFYKIGELGGDDARTVALNKAFYRLFKNGGQFYLLGPAIRQIPSGVERDFKCSFISTEFATVVTEVHHVKGDGDDLGRLCDLVENIEGQTLIYCQSPRRANEVAQRLVEHGIDNASRSFEDEVRWLSDEFHPDWTFQKALVSGVGLHHGRLPRSLGQYAVRAFNRGDLKFLVCTSTLIEGVNTSAKNVVVLDANVGSRPYSYFTFNNIRGRSGRMFHHFIGNVYVFGKVPQEELPFVDFPLITQGEDVPNSLLMQIEEDDLKPRSRDRIAEYLEHDGLPVQIIKKNETLDPGKQVALAEYLEVLDEASAFKLMWRGRPGYPELEAACRLAWDYFTLGQPKSGVYSAKQLSYKAWDLMKGLSVRRRVENELRAGRFAADTADEAIERVFSFDRNWAGFELPRLLMAVSTIQEYVFEKRFGRCGDYSYFAYQLECLFRNPAVVAMEEYGLPLQIGEKVARAMGLSEDLDEALEQVRQVDVSKLSNLATFERCMLSDLQGGL